jgi:protein-S-isoprenylcysteine O-methyltransferase Ste14
MFVLVYALLGYATFLAIMAALVVWLNWLRFPVTHASGEAALAVDLSLMLLFAAQHTVMARAPFKAWLQRTIPAGAERATYVIASNIALAVMMLGWQRMPGMVWIIDGPPGWLLLGIAVLGWLLAVMAMFQFDHWTLFGVRQAIAHWRGRPIANDERFAIPLLYRYVRHPMLSGTLVAFWATPQMSVDRLVLVIGLSVYILIGIQFEERSLLRRFGQDYLDYRAQTPSLLPWPRPHPAIRSSIGPA